MRFIFFTVILILNVTFAQAQSFIDKRGNKHLWGNIQLSDFEQEPFNNWWKEQSIDYNSSLSLDKEDLNKLEVKIFLGTWCGDTKYLLPKFIKTWMQIGMDADDLELIGLHYEGDLYKQGPSGESLGYNIHRVPTIIFERGGQEIGRIVERTVFDLDTDIRQIVTGGVYQNRYRAVDLLDNFMEQLPLDSLQSKNKLQQAIKLVRREVASSSELNTFGYVLKYQDEKAKAHFVFELNRKLFAYHPNVIDSYAESHMDLGNFELAKKAYYEVIRIKQGDEHAVNQLNEIYAREQKIIN